MKAIKQVNHYELYSVLGRGATADVYLGVNKKTHELVAFKKITKKNFESKDKINDFVKEIKILGALKHQNIISLNGFEISKTNVYIALEYANGGNLADYIKKYKEKNNLLFNELLIQKIVKQITSGLEYMHKNNMIHRDIKLENILINFNKFPNTLKKGKLPEPVTFEKTSLYDSFTIKIADLGYSRKMNEMGASTICGTPLAMAPDVAFSEEIGKSYNDKADLWSLGIIVYEMLVGVPPFDAKSYEEYKKKMKDGGYVLPKKLTASLEILTFINGLLQFNPTKRMSWEEINNHPFLVNDVAGFNYLNLEKDVKTKGDAIEMNAKNADNFLWMNYICKEADVALDKLNNQEANKPEVQKQIKKAAVENKQVIEALKQDKLKLEEEKKRLQQEKDDALRSKKEAEDKIKKAEQNDKNIKAEMEKMKKQQAQLSNKDAENMKQLDEFKKKIKELEEKNKENILKIQEAETQRVESLQRQKEILNQQNQLEAEKLKTKEANELVKQKEKEMESLQNDIIEANKAKDAKILELESIINKLKKEQEEMQKKKEEEEKKQKEEEEKKKKEEEEESEDSWIDLDKEREDIKKDDVVIENKLGLLDEVNVDDDYLKDK